MTTPRESDSLVASPGSKCRGGFLTFGAFAIDPGKRLVWRDDQPLAMTAKAFDVLIALIERRGRIVSKDELLTLIWPDTSVQENNLVRQISTLRRLLDERPDQHDYIVTIPGQGYQFVAAVEDSGASTSARGAEGPSSVPSRPSPPRGTWVLAGVVTLLVLGAVVATYRSRVVPTTVGANTARRVLQRVTYDAGVARQASWSPRGDWMVFASDRAGRGDLWKQRIQDPNAVRLTSDGAGDSQPQWSPDGRFVAFRSERDGGGLYVVPADGGTVRKIADFGYDPRWSPNSSLVLFTRSSVLPGSPALFVVGLDGKPPRAVRPDLLSAFSRVRGSWHPDGKRVSLWGASSGDGLVFVNAPLDGGPVDHPGIAEGVRRHLADMRPGAFVWARSGRHLYFEGRAGDTNNIWRITVDDRSGRWVDGPERLTTGAAEDTDLALSNDGTRLLFTTRAVRTRVWAFPYDPATGRTTKAAEPVTSGGAGEVDAETSPDGARLAYTAIRAGRSELWERSIADGRERLLVSTTEARFTRPRWSPDGTRLAYTKRTRSARPQSAVVVLGPDGVEHAVTKLGELEFVPNDWSRDGSALLGACRFSAAERFGVCLMPLASARQAGGPTVSVLASDPKRDLFNQRFSPDYRWIAFLALDAADVSASTVYVTSAAGGRWTAVTEGLAFDDKPRWRPDGRAIYFVSNRTGTPNVWGRRFDPSAGTPTGRPFAVTSFASPLFMLTSRTAEMDIAVSANRLFLPISESQGEVWMLDQVDR